MKPLSAGSKDDVKQSPNLEEATSRSYPAPALEKGLDILELLCRADTPLSQKEIAQRLDRTVGEIYRMLAVLVSRNYVALIDDSYYVTTKLFQLSHINPPTHRLLIEARPIMQQLANDLEQSCHLTVYSQGRQIVVEKIDVPTGMGFSVRVGSELDVLISGSGRVLLAFQSAATQKFRIQESVQRQPSHDDPQIESVLRYICERGFEEAPSRQVRGLFAVSFPILDAQQHAIAALTVPFAERLDQVGRRSISDAREALGVAARLLSARLGGALSATDVKKPTRNKRAA
jgi:DNA-binding IclR family transcriptional regulator